MFLLIGCSPGGPAVNYVAGTVMFDGKPLDKASVYFYPTDSSVYPAVGTTDSHGNYKLTTMQGGGVGKGAMVGEYIVAVTRQSDEPSRSQVVSGERMFFYDSLIPEKYTEQKTSPLKFTVIKGKNRFDINIEK